MERKRILEKGIETLNIEVDAINRAITKLDDNFIGSVEAIIECKGRVVVTGMGKSGIVGKKIAATLASTGTPSFFLHPAEGVHGDIGMLVKGDIVIALSNSGETDEIKILLPLIKRLGVKLISIVGNINSTLARKSDFVLDGEIEREACPMNLAPTASTTVALALGDALAVALVDKRDFKAEDFAMFHPSGSLGKKLLLTVSGIMHEGNELPIVNKNMTILKCMEVVNEKKFGCTAVVDNSNQLVGIITDGDLRRAVTKYGNILDLKSSEIMTSNPKVIDEDELATSALRMMESYKISSIFVVSKEKKIEGLIHIQDLLKIGLI